MSTLPGKIGEGARTLLRRGAPWLGIGLLALAAVGLPKSTTGTLGIATRMERFGPSREAAERRAALADRPTSGEMWRESRHVAPPAVDWRQIESDNLRASAERIAREPASAGSPWRERGSANQTGRTLTTVLSPDRQRLLIGYDGGGIFIGVPGGPWQPHDAVGLLHGVKHLLISTGPEVWLATNGTGGANALVSQDQGVTWSKPANLDSSGYIYAVVQDGGDRKLIYLLALNPQGNLQLYRSTDGGVSFERRIEMPRPPNFGLSDLWTSRLHSGPLYLLYATGKLMVSTDQGATFRRLSTVGGGRSGVGILRASEGATLTFYAVTQDPTSFKNQLWASTDGGRSWQPRFKFGNLFFSAYNGSLAVSQRNPNVVLFGGFNAYASSDGGQTFKLINDWGAYYKDPVHKMHADINGIDVLAWKGRETFFLNTDGGTYLLQDGGRTVTNATLEGFDDAEYYSRLTDPTNPDHIVAGAQDQGLQVSRPQPGVMQFDQVINGDRGGLSSSSPDLSRIYVSSPYGIDVLQVGARGVSGISAGFPPIRDNAFLPFLLADPKDPKSVYVAGDHIFRMGPIVGRGGFPVKQLPQDFSAGKGDFLTALAISPANPNVWYAASTLGRLWSSHDHGATWTHTEENNGAFEWFSATSLLPSPTDPETCYVGGSGYNQLGAVLVTRDGGHTWRASGDGLPQTLVWSLAFDNAVAQRVYAAADAGPFVLDPATGQWTSLLDAVSPLVRYQAVESVPAAGIVRFATYGRGIWDYQVP